jgi:hypothetical protein
MKKSAALFILGMFAGNLAMAQSDSIPVIDGFRFINLEKDLGGKKLGSFDESCGCSSALINIDPNNKEIYFSDQKTLEEFSRDKKFIEDLKDMTPQNMEDEMSLPAENYLKQEGAENPFMLIRKTRLGNGFGQWDTGFQRWDLTPFYPRPDRDLMPEPLIF